MRGAGIPNKTCYDFIMSLHNEHPKIKVVVACQKGGVGKTTLALNLYIEAIRRGFVDSAIYDADPQASAMLISEQRQRLHGQSLPVYQEPPAASIVIVDTAPHANAQLPGLIKDAGLVLIPVRPAVLDLAAAQTTIDVVKHHGRLAAAVLMLTSPRAPEIAEAEAWISQQGIELAGIVHHRVDVSRAAGQGLGICEMHASHPGATEFSAVADFVFRHELWDQAARNGGYADLADLVHRKRK